MKKKTRKAIKKMKKQKKMNFTYLRRSHKTARIKSQETPKKKKMKQIGEKERKKMT